MSRSTTLEPLFSSLFFVSVGWSSLAMSEGVGDSVGDDDVGMDNFVGLVVGLKLGRTVGFSVGAVVGTHSPPTPKLPSEKQHI